MDRAIPKVERAIPRVRKFMTHSPHTIGREQMLAVAHRLFSQHRIRHLPVLDGGKLLGIVSDRDIRLIESLRDVDPEKVPVEDAMTQDVYCVTPDTPLDEVVFEMAERKYGSAVVMDHGKVVGIFTTIDALHVLSETLHGRIRV